MEFRYLIEFHFSCSFPARKFLRSQYMRAITRDRGKHKLSELYNRKIESRLRASIGSICPLVPRFYLIQSLINIPVIELEPWKKI